MVEAADKKFIRCLNMYVLADIKIPKPYDKIFEWLENFFDNSTINCVSIYGDEDFLKEFINNNITYFKYFNTGTIHIAHSHFIRKMEISFSYIQHEEFLNILCYYLKYKYNLVIKKTIFI